MDGYGYSLQGELDKAGTVYTFTNGTENGNDREENKNTICN
jgi:hypothetical protein